MQELLRTEFACFFEDLFKMWMKEKQLTTLMKDMTQMPNWVVHCIDCVTAVDDIAFF